MMTQPSPPDRLQCAPGRWGSLGPHLTSRSLPLATALIAALITTLSFVLPTPAQASMMDWWLTPNQQGQRLYDQGDYDEAARRFTDPARIGAALFAAGDFEGAAAVYGRQAGPEGPYNRGVAQVFLGQYEAAIVSFQRALELKPGWTEAQENLAIAEARRAALAPPEDDAGGTGGMLGADEIVMDDRGGASDSQETEVIEATEGVTDEASLRALWLRRVDTRPADFLAAKFNAQRIRQQQPVTGDETPESPASPGPGRETGPEPRPDSEPGSGSESGSGSGPGPGSGSGPGPGPGSGSGSP